MNSIDSLTGFLNRFGCIQTTIKLVANSTADTKPLAVIWVDLDRFKQVNESFGQLGGDELIGKLGMRFRNRISGRAELARMGGDEFLFLVPNCDRDYAQQLAKELAATVEEPLAIGNLTLRRPRA